MPSTKTDKTHFSMDDFEKGLMLAGYIMPSSVTEIIEREKLAEYEAQLASQSKNIYFKRAVLAAEIAAQLHNEFAFGRVKFQKLVYMCEHAAHMNLEHRYQKQAAGPFDNKFMHTIDKEFKKQKWFSVEKVIDNNISRYKYTPLENIENYKRYYDNYYKHLDDSIQFIIELFRKKKTDFTELATTVFACYLELKENHTAIPKDLLLKLFYDWSEKKKRFPENEVIDSYHWLQNNGLIPVSDVLY